MVSVYNVDGSVEGRLSMTFKEAQVAVGGLVEVLRVDGGVLLVNEEGRLRGLPLNINASLQCGGPLYGPVVVLTAADVDVVLGTDDQDGDVPAEAM